jgi:hypothetical protein
MLVWWRAAPIVSFADRWNIGRTGDGSVTISGLQFGWLGLSPTTSLEDSAWDSVNHACSCTSWTTGTTVVCNAVASRAGLVREVVTVGGAVGTRTQTFTFDGTHAYRSANVHALLSCDGSTPSVERVSSPPDAASVPGRMSTGVA